MIEYGFKCLGELELGSTRLIIGKIEHWQPLNMPEMLRYFCR